MQRTKLSFLIAALLAAPYCHADDADLRARIDHLEAEIQALKAELNQVNSKDRSDRQPAGGDQPNGQHVCSLE